MAENGCDCTDGWGAEEQAAELPATFQGECVYCENTTADFRVMPREDKALRVRCEGCGAVTEIERD